MDEEAGLSGFFGSSRGGMLTSSLRNLPTGRRPCVGLASKTSKLSSSS